DVPVLPVRGLRERAHHGRRWRQLAAPGHAAAGVHADPRAARQGAVLAGGHATVTDAGQASEPARWIELEHDGSVATILLNRPDKLNAWSWESARQLAARADEVRFDD